MWMLIVAVLSGFMMQASKGAHPPDLNLPSVSIREPFAATIYYTPEAELRSARMVIEADWDELGPETIVTLINKTTERASPQTMTSKNRRLILWLDEAFPEGEYLEATNDLRVEILSTKGLLGRSPMFQISLK